MSLFPITTESKDFISLYRSYTSHTTIPRIYNEFAAILAISSVLARSCWIDRGYYKVFPNLYAMLIGDPGTGKGTACDILQGVLQDAGYTRFGPNRSTKEKFLVDLQDGFDVDTESSGERVDSLIDDFFKSEISSSRGSSGITSDVFILAEEMSDFFGTDNLEFITLLTALWSYKGTYKQRIKTGRSVHIPNPCINIFAGATHDSFQQTFPSRLLGTGFLARFILIYGSIPADSEIAFPESPVVTAQGELGKILARIKHNTLGQIEIQDAEKLVFSEVLKYYSGPQDARFKHYKTRRFVQLLKIAISFAASNLRTRIIQEDILNANTLLYMTEQEMGKALGEFGKSKNSEVANKIMQALYATIKPLNTLEIFKLVSNDLSKIQELNDIMTNLQGAEKVRFVTFGTKQGGYLANRQLGASLDQKSEEGKKLINWDYFNYLAGGD